MRWICLRDRHSAHLFEQLADLNADWIKMSTKCSRLNERRVCQTLKQYATNFSFHPLNGNSDSWLCDTTFFRCACEVKLFANCKKIADVLRLHDCALDYG